MEEEISLRKEMLTKLSKTIEPYGLPSIENEIPRFIQAIAHGNFSLANDILAERTNLPSIVAAYVRAKPM